jgi:DNA replication protein DnaC
VRDPFGMLRVLEKHHGFGPEPDADDNDTNQVSEGATNMAVFKKATKLQSKLRLALLGPTGSGKTYTALRVAKALGKRVALIDTERGSASKYSSEFDFDVLELETFAPATYVEAIRNAEAEGYDVLVIDSLSHAWMGKEGALEQVDKVGKRSGGSSGGNNFAAWREVTPMHNGLVDTILSAKMHVIATMRVKMEYVMEDDGRGKKSVRKVGLQPQQRDSLEYEFDVIADIDQEHNFIVSKTRCRALDGLIVKNAGEDVAAKLLAWLTDGAPVVDPVAALLDKLPDVRTPEAYAAELETAKRLRPTMSVVVREAVKLELERAAARVKQAQEDAAEAEAAERALAAQEAAEQGDSPLASTSSATTEPGSAPSSRGETLAAGGVQ